MRSSGELDLIAKSMLFRGLESSSLTWVLEAARDRSLAREVSLFRQGGAASHVYLLIRGRVRLSQLTVEGHRVVMRILGPGEMIGAIAALADTVYPATAEAFGACQLLSWDGGTLARLMERYPKIALNALRILADRLHELQDRYLELATERVERRVAQALLRLAAQAGRRTDRGVLIDLPLSRQDLAEMTGTTLFTVSRILAAWNGEGLLDVGRKRVLIRKPHGLMAISDGLVADAESHGNRRRNPPRDRARRRPHA